VFRAPLQLVEFDIEKHKGYTKKKSYPKQINPISSCRTFLSQFRFQRVPVLPDNFLSHTLMQTHH
jgi:hypothetical protein